MKEKSYSQLNKRDRIAEDLRRIDKDIQFYVDCGDDYTDKVEDLRKYRDRIQVKADHYDREVSEGYEKPAAVRNGISTGLSDGMRSESIETD